MTQSIVYSNNPINYRNYPTTTETEQPKSSGIEEDGSNILEESKQNNQNISSAASYTPIASPLLATSKWDTDIHAESKNIASIASRLDFLSDLSIRKLDKLTFPQRLKELDIWKGILGTGLRADKNTEITTLNAAVVKYNAAVSNSISQLGALKDLNDIGISNQSAFNLIVKAEKSLHLLLQDLDNVDNNNKLLAHNNIALNYKNQKNDSAFITAIIPDLRDSVVQLQEAVKEIELAEQGTRSQLRTAIAHLKEEVSQQCPKLLGNDLLWLHQLRCELSHDSDVPKALERLMKNGVPFPKDINVTIELLNAFHPLSSLPSNMPEPPPSLETFKKDQEKSLSIDTGEYYSQLTDNYHDLQNSKLGTAYLDVLAAGGERVLAKLNEEISSNKDSVTYKKAELNRNTLVQQLEQYYRLMRVDAVNGHENFIFSIDNIEVKEAISQSVDLARQYAENYQQYGQVDFTDGHLMLLARTSELVKKHDILSFEEENFEPNNLDLQDGALDQFSALEKSSDTINLIRLRLQARECLQAQQKLLDQHVIPEDTVDPRKDLSSLINQNPAFLTERFELVANYNQALSGVIKRLDDKDQSISVDKLINPLQMALKMGQAEQAILKQILIASNDLTLVRELKTSATLQDEQNKKVDQAKISAQSQIIQGLSTTNHEMYQLRVKVLKDNTDKIRELSKEEYKRGDLIDQLNCEFQVGLLALQREEQRAMSGYGYPEQASWSAWLESKLPARSWWSSSYRESPQELILAHQLALQGMTIKDAYEQLGSVLKGYTSKPVGTLLEELGFSPNQLKVWATSHPSEMQALSENLTHSFGLLTNVGAGFSTQVKEVFSTAWSRGSTANLINDALSGTRTPIVGVKEITPMPPAMVALLHFAGYAPYIAGTVNGITSISAAGTLGNVISGALGVNSVAALAIQGVFGMAQTHTEIQFSEVLKKHRDMEVLISALLGTSNEQSPGIIDRLKKASQYILQRQAIREVGTIVRDTYEAGKLGALQRYRNELALWWSKSSPLDKVKLVAITAVSTLAVGAIAGATVGFIIGTGGAGLIAIGVIALLAIGVTTPFATRPLWSLLAPYLNISVDPNEIHKELNTHRLESALIEARKNLDWKLAQQPVVLTNLNAEESNILERSQHELRKEAIKAVTSELQAELIRLNNSGTEITRDQIEDAANRIMSENNRTTVIKLLEKSREEWIDKTDYSGDRRDLAEVAEKIDKAIVLALQANE
ncbi:hypothetical protein [Chitinimonas sp. BJB300]|uniref:hypothetical protein n=1 Tax=Chitinimonas sp. BJB300 TaxID=1559339 RepID=UPI000C114699|nr:hypothetical protein [Chitinimonas sp. BJB300]PHV13020.1 hypothetical protein CSQ89_02830 [Chitinimonas sp. BJB300]TSJ88922.1 hypothetical protein FG002_008495 [Chitinimonas sp. BJB300]